MRYLGRKLIQLVIVTFVVTLLTFLLMSALPGDRAVAIGGVVGGENAEQYYDQVRAEWGLDRPLVVQYGTWLGKFVTGDLGRSTAFTVPVSDLIVDRFPITLTLMVYALVVSLLVAIPLGVYTAYRANGLGDRIVNTTAFAFLSVPTYVLGVALILLFSVRLGWFPADSDVIWPWDDPWEHARNLVLPVFTLAVGQIAIYMRLLRTDMAATLQQDYITLARSKGLSNRFILFRHALRPSLFAMVTAAAVNVGALIGGSIIVERMYGLPGMGTLVVEAIFRRDFLVVQACVVIFAVTFVVANFVVDILYAVIDPRVRHARALA